MPIQAQCEAIGPCLLLDDRPSILIDCISLAYPVVYSSMIMHVLCLIVGPAD